MEKRPKHRPKRRFEKMERMMFDCEMDVCPHCGMPLRARRPWPVRKTVQTMKGVVRLVGKSKECVNPKCAYCGEHYHASGVWLVSLPHSSYGLDVVAYIGWRHEHEHKQLAEIQKELNEHGVEINESTVGKQYRQFLALLGGLQVEMRRTLEATVEKHGGVIWAMDALEPEGCGSLLYVLYEVLSSKPVAALQVEGVSAVELAAWLKPYQDPALPVLATLSDGEDRIAAAFKSCWPDAPPQRCQVHFLGNLAEEVLKEDDQLRKNLRDDLGGLPTVPKQAGAGGQTSLF
jgi:hypothetical protein